MQMTVNALIVGAQKAGTTALAAFLSEHADICVAPRKEVHLFDAPDFTDSREYCDARYASAFPNFAGQRVVLEATPIYMFLPAALRRIRHYNPAMKLIALLRHPAERALSHYAMERSRGDEWLPPCVALACERARLWRARRDMSWDSAIRTHSYIARGYYSQQIADILACFPRGQLLLLRTDELRTRHEETLESVYRFLAVESPKIAPLGRTVLPDIGAGGSRVPRPSRFTSAALTFVYRREVRRVERILGTRLQHWLQAPRA